MAALEKWSISSLPSFSGIAVSVKGKKGKPEFEVQQWETRLAMHSRLSLFPVSLLTQEPSPHG
jgi:hypothetical protein